ncbi:hypothetical protein OIV83_006392 [Microbotryomycetes sp. JL201]|nr:hypothetical protein OIV83_006392 [Microbotryomycetes sp. JL201]
MSSTSRAPSGPPAYNDRVSEELDEALGNLLHSSLEIHEERERMQHTGRMHASRAGSGRAQKVPRVRSVEGLRLAPTQMHDTGSVPASEPTQAQGSIANMASNDSVLAPTSCGPLLRRVTSMDHMLDCGSDDNLDNDAFTSEVRAVAAGDEAQTD